MAFDGNPHDYTRVASPPKVYDRNNPPKTMSEAIRMAVGDLTGVSAAKVGFDWFDCCKCLAGLALSGAGLGSEKWDAYGEEWGNILQALSDLSNPCNNETLSDAYYVWPAGFSHAPSFRNHMVDYREHGMDAYFESLRDVADRLEAEAS